jgi:AcrR family transcriptional regulator
MARRKIISDEAVLDAAMGVMFARGPSDFTLADIAAVVGIAPATLIQRFGDKRRLVLATFSRENERFARTLTELPPASGAAAVIAVLRLVTPDIDDAALFSQQLLWLRQDMRDGDLNALARERFGLLRQAVAQRLPPLPMAREQAAMLVEAQWQGALNQWGMAPEGRLVDFVTQSLAAWFILVGGRRR